jgi:hypothetical protein
MEVAKREGATPYDVTVEFSHHGKDCSFDGFVKEHHFDRGPAIVLMAKIINGADPDNSSNDDEMLTAEPIICDASLRTASRRSVGANRGRSIPVVRCRI